MNYKFKATIISICGLIIYGILALGSDDGGPKTSGPKSSSHYAIPDSNYTPEEMMSIGFDIVSFLSNHPVIKALKALKIVGSIIKAGEPNAAHAGELVGKYAKESSTLHFNTLNPNVTGKIRVTANGRPKDEKITFHTPSGSYEFSPNKFMQDHDISNINNYSTLSLIDSKLLKDYTQCTGEALETGEGNLIKLLKLRITCMEQKGYGTNDIAYMRIKHEKY